MGAHTLLEDDQVFLHLGEPVMARRKAAGDPVGRMYYAPSPADMYVLALHRWLQRYGGGGPFGSIDEAYLSRLGPRLSQEQLLDRYSQHTQHCAQCQRGQVSGGRGGEGQGRGRGGAGVGRLVGRLDGACNACWCQWGTHAPAEGSCRRPTSGKGSGKLLTSPPFLPKDDLPAPPPLLGPARNVTAGPHCHSVGGGHCCADVPGHRNSGLRAGSSRSDRRCLCHLGS